MAKKTSKKSRPAQAEAIARIKPKVITQPKPGVCAQLGLERLEKRTQKACALRAQQLSKLLATGKVPKRLIPSAKSQLSVYRSEARKARKA